MGNKPSEMGPLPPTVSSRFCESTRSCLPDTTDEGNHQLTSSAWLEEYYFYDDNKDRKDQDKHREGCQLETSCWIIRPLTSMQRLPLLTVASDDCSSQSSSSVTTTQGSLSSANSLSSDCAPITERIFEEATMFESQGKFDMAFDAYQRCLELEERRFQNTNTTVSAARAHFKMGQIHWRRGNYNDSLRQLEQAAAVYQKDRINNNYNYYSTKEDLAEVLLAMGKTHASLGNRQQAVEIFEKALSVLKSSGSDDDRSTTTTTTSLIVKAQVLHALGEAHASMGGNSTLSLWHLQEAITIQFRVLGQNHVDVAATLLSFGPLLEKNGHLMDAMACFEYALEIYRSQDSLVCSVDMAVALAHLGWIHYLHGRLNDSLALYNDALERLTLILGPRHRNIASLLVQMGMLYHEQAELQRALSLFQKAHDIQLAALGNEHEDVAHTLCLMSSTHKNLGNLKEAGEFVDEAVRIYGVNHANVDDALVLQATTLRREIEAC